MSTLIKNTLLACGLALAAGPLFAAAPAAADAKKPVKAKVSKAKAKPAEAEPAAEPEPDIAGTTTTEFHCELGNKVTTYHNDNDNESLAVRWKKRLHRLTRVGTTTGAQRFENRLFGLVWIGIPAKGMLLDSKLNRQLANECKSEAQLNPAPVAAPAAPVIAVAPAAPLVPNAVAGERTPLPSAVSPVRAPMQPLPAAAPEAPALPSSPQQQPQQQQ